MSSNGESFDLQQTNDIDITVTGNSNEVALQGDNSNQTVNAIADSTTDLSLGGRSTSNDISVSSNGESFDLQQANDIDITVTGNSNAVTLQDSNSDQTVETITDAGTNVSLSGSPTNTDLSIDSSGEELVLQQENELDITTITGNSNAEDLQSGNTGSVTNVDSLADSYSISDERTTDDLTVQGNSDAVALEEAAQPNIDVVSETISTDLQEQQVNDDLQINSEGLEYTLTDSTSNTDIDVDMSDLQGLTDFVAVNPLETLELPQLDGLFVVNDGPNSNYIVETNPQFSNYLNFIGSDYLLERLGYTPEMSVRRLGDSFYETRLIRDAIFNTTGQRYLSSSFNSDQEQLRYLMDNALASQAILDLELGEPLTARQQSELFRDIVWLEKQIITLPNGDTEEALVPVLYLASVRPEQLTDSGALIAGNNVNLKVDGDLNNFGGISAESDLRLLAGQDILTSGVLSGKNQVTLTTINGDIISERRVDSNTTITSTGGEYRFDQLGRETRIEGNRVTLNSGRDIVLRGTQVDAQGDLNLKAQRDITVGSVSTTNSGHANFARTRMNYEKVEHSGSSLSSGGSIGMLSGSDLTISGSQVSASGDIALQSGGNLSVLATADKLSDEFYHRGHGSKTHSIEKSVTHNASLLESGGNLSLNSGQGLSVVGSNLEADGSMTLRSAGSTVISAAEDTNYSYFLKKDKGDGLSSDKSSSWESASLIHTGGNLTAGDDITILSGDNLLAYGAALSAQGDVTLAAQNDLNIIAAIDTEDYSYTREKDGSVRQSSLNRGYHRETIAGGSISSGGNLVVDSAEGGIQLIGAELSSPGNMRLGSVTVTQNEQGSLDMGTLAETQLQGTENISVESLELRNEEWNERSKGFSGIVKDLVKGAAFVASAGTIQAGILMPDLPEITVAEGQTQRTSQTLHSQSTLTADNLTIQTEGLAHFGGAELQAKQDINVLAKDILLDAVANTTETYSAEFSDTVSTVKKALSEDELTLGGAKHVKETDSHSSSTTTWQGTRLQAENINLLATNDINVIGSTLAAETDLNAVAGNTLTVTGKQDEVTTVDKHRVDTETFSVGVKNAYVDVVHAAKAVDDATAAVSDAKSALSDAKQKVKDGKLRQQDLKYYEANLAAATANLGQATLALASAGGAAAASTATGGFYASGSLARESTETVTTVQQKDWKGSLLTAGRNTNLTSGNELTITGSDVFVGGTLALSSQDILINAGQSTQHSTTEVKHNNQSISGSYGAAGPSGSVQLGYRNSESESQSLTHRNSQISAGTLISNSEVLTVSGANLVAGHVDIAANTLTVESLQNTASSKDKTRGGSVGAGFGASGLTSVNAGIEKSDGSSERLWVDDQTQILGTESINIRAKDTTITGAVIANASINEDGGLIDHGNLNFQTENLVVHHLYDIDKSESKGFNASVSINVSGQQSNDSQSDYKLKVGNTTLGGHYNGYEKEQTTYATLGNGNVTVGGEALANSDINRDLSNTQEITKDIEIGGLNASVTVDHRLFSEAGRQDIANNFVDSAEHIQDIARTTDDIASKDDLNILNFGENLHNRATATQLKNDLLRKPENAGILEGLKSGDPELYAQAMKDLGHLAQNKFGLSLSDIGLYDADKTTSGSLADSLLTDVKGATVVDPNHAQAGSIHIDVSNNADGTGVAKTDMVNTLGHEVLETQDFQGQDSSLTGGLFGTNTEAQQEALANSFGEQFADRINQAAGGELDSTGGGNFNQNLINSQAVSSGTEKANGVGNAKVDYRQAHKGEILLIDRVADDYAKSQNLSPEEARQVLTQQALAMIDEKWANQTHIEEDQDAINFLINAAAEDGQLLSDANGETHLAFELARDEDYYDSELNNTHTKQLEHLGAGEYVETENGRELHKIEKGWIEKYGTEYGHNPYVEGITEATVEGFVEDGKKVLDKLTNLTPEKVANAVITKVEQGIDTITNPETYKPEYQEGTEGVKDVAQAQGDKETLVDINKEELLENAGLASAVIAPGIGKLAKEGVEEAVDLANEAAEQAGKKIDVHLDVDGEMVGQDKAPYDAVIHSSRPSNEVNQDMINQGYVPAWSDDSSVQDVTLMPGYQMEQMIDQRGSDLLSEGDPNSLGRWAADDALPDYVQDARDVTAVKKEWKDEDKGSLEVVKIEVAEPLNANRGPARPVYDEQLDRALPGGVNQLELKEGKENTFEKVDVLDSRILLPDSSKPVESADLSSFGAHKETDHSIGAAKTPKKMLNNGDDPYDGIEYEVVKSDDASGAMPDGYVGPSKNTSELRAKNTVALADKPLEPLNPNKAQHGHGNAEHGYQTTASQQENRIVTGVKPSGQPGNPTSKASKFLTPELEAEALGRGRVKLEQDIKEQNIPKMVNGEPNRHPVTVETNQEGGFGERWIRAKDENGQNLKDTNGSFIPQKDSAKLNKANLIFEYVPSTDSWEPVTYFPVD